MHHTTFIELRDLIKTTEQNLAGNNISDAMECCISANKIIQLIDDGFMPEPSTEMKEKRIRYNKSVSRAFCEAHAKTQG
jgi:hypothetical protein